MAVKQPLALIHCGLGRASNWRPFLNVIDRPVSPLLIELPGHGLAEKYDTSRDFADQAIELALEEMPSEPVPLIGHSFGAVLALRIAVARHRGARAQQRDLGAGGTARLGVAWRAEDGTAGNDDRRRRRRIDQREKSGALHRHPL